MTLRDLAEFLVFVLATLRDLVFVLAVLLLVGMWFGSCLAIGEAQQQSDDCQAVCAPSHAVTPIVGGQETCLCGRGSGAWQRVSLPAEKN